MATITTPVKEGTLTAIYRDPQTGQTMAHKDLVEVRAPWADREAQDAYIAPVKETRNFGDVESWVAYVTRYGVPDTTLVTWDSHGLKAVLDYHTKEQAGRAAWCASYPFAFAEEWLSWMTLVTAQAVPHAKAVEALENLGDTIVDPPTADFLALLRSLRANSTAKTEATIREDGTTDLSFERKTDVSGPKNATLPPTLRIAVQVLDGHDVRYELTVRLRAQVDADGKLSLRFAIPAADKALEEVYRERVDEAKAVLGDKFPVLRAAG